LKLDCNILHLEDDDNDSLFFQRGLERLKFNGAYRRVSTIRDAMDYLSGQGDYTNQRLYPAPHVLVADGSLGALSGPRTSDLMSWLDAREQFRSLVRIMLTGGMSASDQESWIKRGISCVLLKGASHEDIAASVEEILRRC
jgi:hypothetical protein